MAPLPADELARSREEVPVVPHEVVRHHHGVNVVASDLVGAARMEDGEPGQWSAGLAGIARDCN